MRAALILSLLLAILAAVFALQNPGYTDLQFGPYDFRASTALVILTAFGLGALFGTLASFPARLRDKRKVRNLEKRLVEERQLATPTSSEPDPALRPHKPSTDI